MKTFKDLRESVTEVRKDSAKDTYFNTYSAAVQYARAQAEKQGYEVDEDDWFRQVSAGKGKPSRGKTTRHTLKLSKNGKPARKGLSIQVYNRDTDNNTYELNYYVS
jgi:membrane protein involved in colicin uptake